MLLKILIYADQNDIKLFVVANGSDLEIFTFRRHPALRRFRGTDSIKWAAIINSFPRDSANMANPHASNCFSPAKQILNGKNE